MSGLGRPFSDRIHEFVDHVIPGEGFIDWDRLMSVLKQTSFAGPLLLEVLTKYSPEAQKGPESFLRLAYTRGTELYQQITA
jgi:sugar phosphate isomerase/epimerase